MQRSVIKRAASNLKPDHGLANAAYDVNGQCPSAFPVKIPTVNMNVAYVLHGITRLDTRQAQVQPFMKSACAV